MNLTMTLKLMMCLASVLLILRFVHQALPKNHKILSQSYQRIIGKLLKFCLQKNDVKFFLRSEVLCSEVL